MPRRRIVVVGASLAGVRTVQALRRREVDADLVLVGNEAGLPYDRPPLSKDVLLGKADAADVRLVSQQELDDLDVEVLTGTATSLDTAARVVTVDLAGTLEPVAYDDLVIATGASARRPAGLPGPADLAGVHLLRCLDDALSLRAALADGPRVVVLGGGFIGAETASAARSMGLDVTIVDLAPVLMQRALGDGFGARMGHVAVDHGVRLRLGSSIDDVAGNGRVESVRLHDGTSLDADLLVIGVGAAPNDQWLDDSGLSVADGVICDQYLRAAPHVYAVGDVARWHHPLYGRAIRTEHWTSAGEQADAVAATLGGTETVCDAVPWAWSDQFGIKLQVAGIHEPDDELHVVLDSAPKLVAVSGSHGIQHAAFGISAPGAMIRQRMALATRPTFPPTPA